MTIKQLSVFIENKTGRINEVTKILAANNINMTAFSLAENAEFGILRMVVSNVDLAVKILKEARFGVNVTDVVCFTLSNVPGALSTILDLLSKEQIFIEYMYAFSQGETANVVIRPTDVDRCIDILTENKTELLSKANLSQI
ncbi:MAG: amino acid-binding protein [Prevotellaceae bacterium]|jgi:hypothetical protein|nr:amino acid-binding protein [Prevotellaceae bacterium]